MPAIWLDVDTALAEVPVTIMPLIADSDFKTRQESVTYNQAGLDLVWNFVTSAGAYTQTAVTPTTAGVYDWTNQGNGMYSIEIPASGGGSINNDAEGYGWFTGFATGILPWCGPVIGFRAAALNDALTDGGDLLDVNTTQIAGTAQTANDNGADINAILIDTNELQTDWANGGRLDLILDSRMAEASINTTAGAVDNVTLVATTTTNTDMVSAAPTAAQVADQVWLETLADHSASSGSTAEALNAAGAAGDPWTTVLPGAYGAGTAGEILGDWKNGGRLDAILDSRMAEASINTTAGAVDNVTLVATTTTNTDMRGTDNAATAAALVTVDTEVGQVKAKTDLLTFTDGANVDANIQKINDVTITGDGSGTPFNV